MHTKKAAIIGAVVLLLGLGALLALPYLIDVNQYRGRVQAALQERLGREISLGEIHLSLLPPGLRVDEVVIGEDRGLQTGRPFARVQQFYVSPRLLPLLGGRFELRSVELRRPVIELVRTASGEWNFSSLGASEAAATEDSGGGGTGFALNRLVITDGQLALSDQQDPDAGRAIYENIDVRLDDFAPDEEFDVMVAVTLPGEGAQLLTVNGTGGPIAQDAIATTPFDGTIELEDVSISGVQQFLKAEALEGTDASISGEADLRNEAGRLTVEGSLDLADARARGVAIEYPIAAGFNLTHDSSSQVLTIDTGTVRLGDTPLSLTGRVNLAPETPELDVRATASDASLAEAARLASAFGVAFGSGTEVDGTLDADVQARGPATLPALEGRVQLRNVSISGADIPQPVRTDAVDLALTPEEIRSNEFAVGTGGTSVTVRGAVRQYTTSAPSIDARMRTTGADVGELINVAHAWGVEAAEGLRGTGRLTLDVHATGPTDALTFSGSGALSEATFHSPAIAQPVGVRSARLSFDRDAAILDELVASFGKTTAEGRLAVRNFAAPQLQFALSADTIDVAEIQQLMSGAPETDTTSPAPAPDEDGLLRRTTGSGTIRVGSIVHNALVLEDVQATATLDRGLVSLDPLTAMLFDGRHRGAIVMDARTSPATFSVASNLEQVDANRLASAMTSLRDVIYGALGTRLRLEFAAADGARLARSLNGSMGLNLAQGRIANVNIMQEIGNIAQFVAGGAPDERTTQIAGLSGNFTITDGVARTDDLTASIESGTVGAVGTIDLADQSLDLHLTAVLSRESSARVGGTTVGGFLSTALANQQGELVIPMRVTGTAQQPRFAPDVEQVAQMKLRNLVPSLRDPQALTSGVLGAIGGGNQQEGGAAGGRIRDLVGAITGREKPKEGEDPPPAPPPQGQEPAEPEEPRQDPGSRIEDALRGILGGRQKPPPEK